MKLRTKKEDYALILIASILLLVTAVVGWSLLGETVIVPLLVLSTLLILGTLLELYRRLEDTHKRRLVDAREHRRNLDDRRKQEYKQIESLFSLFFTLKPSLPLPDTGGWAASPDLLKKVTEVIFAEKPSLIVEASSGVSTLIIAYCLKQLGNGKVVSLEHDAKFAAISRERIEAHGLEDIATIIHAPLKEFQLNGQKWLWYNTDCLKIDQPIDLLTIDGPPGQIQKLSRYPALPLLFTHLNSSSVIILDDGQREDERQIIDLWEKEFNHLSSEYLNLEKGAFIIRKNECVVSV